jgi:hypothetical protein
MKSTYKYLYSIVVVGLMAPMALYAAPPKAKITTPTIAQEAASDVSIDVRVGAPAGGTGLPGGFSLQWMSAAEFAQTNCYTNPSTLITSCAAGWYLSEDPRLCKASFSGKANGYNYNIAAGSSIVVTVGDFLLDEGASTTCNTNLSCGTTYVFHAFGHAANNLQRSDWTANSQFTTSECATNCPTRSSEFPFTGACTNTQGFWGTHSPVPKGNNVNQWAYDTSMTLGLVTYTDLQLQGIMDAAVSGNGLISLAHQLISAMLNISHGAPSTPEVDAAIAAAHALIGSKVIPPVGAGFAKPGDTSTIADVLRDFNEGAIGPGHCLEGLQLEICRAGAIVNAGDLI